MPEQEGFGKQSKHRISPLWLKKYFNLDKQAQDGQQRHRSRPESDNLAAKGEARYVYAELYFAAPDQPACLYYLVVLISSNPPIHPPIRSSSPLTPLALHFRKLQPSSAAWRTSPLHDHNNGQGGRRGAPPPPLPHGHRGYPQQPNPPTHSGFPRHHQQALPTAPPPAAGQEPSPTPMMPPPLAQLPPQMFTTAAQLLDLTDTNLVLQGTVERLYAGNLFADIQRGIYLVRGENVLLLGEVDLDKEDDIPTGYRQAPFEEVFALKKQEDNERKKRNKRSSAKLQTLGFEAEHSGEVLF
ncbi:small nuclear ribonucleoprotein [Histoplasma capsulatum H143]|uniref:Small nuclear ribonucleoprotein n=1 Tax=Ajellomyces capsulatus (strain H143) TaxID=544712 RepID=C6HK85_AJECH|nr:small nuclear ribonucleoprotein [Histoplasma capsulatum H143]